MILHWKKKLFIIVIFILIGKFPHLVASVPGSKKSSELSNSREEVLDFGEVPVQTTASKWIELHNFSPVSVVTKNSFADSGSIY